MVFVLFHFWGYVFFTSYVICSCRKRFKRNSQKQPFINVRKKHLCSSLFLIKLRAWGPAFLFKKRFLHRCFPVNIAKFLRTVFLWNTFCSSHFYVMIGFFGRSGYKIEVFHVSCTTALFSFIILVLESELDSYFVLVFIPKCLVNAPFARITTSAPALFWLNQLQNFSDFSQ